MFIKIETIVAFHYSLSISTYKMGATDRGENLGYLYKHKPSLNILHIIYYNILSAVCNM